MTEPVFSPDAFASSIDVSLVPVPGAVSLARRLTREWLRHWRFPDRFCESVGLVVTELVTNAVTKADGDTIGLRVRLAGPSVRVEVWDGDPAPPIMRRPADTDSGGRGLLLVTAFSARWGHYRAAGGKVVWAELAHGDA